MRNKAILVGALLLATSWHQAQAQSSDLRTAFSRQVGGFVTDATRRSTESGALDAVDSLSRLFGADNLRERFMLKREGDRYFAGLSGSGGEWFKSLSDAQGFLFRSTLAASGGVPAEVKEALASQSSADLSGSATTATNAVVDNRILIGKGASTSVTLKPKRLAATGVPTVVGGKGTRIEDVQRSGDSLTVRVAVTQAATVGPTTLSVFNPGTAFLAADRMAAFVVAGEGEPAPPVRKGGATAASALLIQSGDRIDDNLPVSVGANFYRVLLASAGPLTVSTTGPSDTVVSVQDENGNQLGTDDDSGDWYNSKLTVNVTPGAYVVKVAHCCQGVGSYRLTVTAGQ